MSISTAAVDQAAEATAAAASREADMTTTPAQAQPACWHMKGRLTSTASGRTIALVEGVELSRSLAFEVAASDGRKSTFASRNGGGNGGGGTADSMRVAGTGSNGENGAEGELAVDQALRKPRSWTAFGALASSKFFMYQVSVWYFVCLFECTFGCKAEWAKEQCTYIFICVPVLWYDLLCICFRANVFLGGIVFLRQSAWVSKVSSGFCLLACHLQFDIADCLQAYIMN